MIFEITPVTKPRMTQRDKWLQPARPGVERYRAFATELVKIANLADFTLPASYEIVFHIPMPKSWSQKKRAAMNKKPHQQTPDIDNLIKAFQDALVDDDSFVHTVLAQKVWSLDGGIVVERFR